ncbi:hypothetical protein TCAL_01737 [Tigriopus californicus]|uniref:Major facilitator superfamily (MFS) profile domain-containing protein n=1 Tax=Tigriopus californicus TaxID=6832 RepID=A0A553PKZ1_TIGCA|nr:hypothetical protein TCAL_01737 [Tigriopus californicus]
MSFEIYLSQIGDFHRYQFLLMVFIFYTTFMTGINYYTQIFLFSVPPHECRIPSSSSSSAPSSLFLPASTLLNSSLQFQGSPWQNLAQCQFPTNISLSHSLENGTPTVAVKKLLMDGLGDGDLKWNHCTQGWNYDTSNIFMTVVAEILIACLRFRMGRKPTVLFSHVVYFLGGIGTYFAHGFVPIAIARFMVGMSHHIISHLPYLIALEYCGVKKRVIPLLTMMLAYSLASVTIPIISHELSHWHELLFLATFPNLLVVILFPWVPESPSWLLCNNKFQEAGRILQQVAKINGTDVRPVLKDLESQISKARSMEKSRVQEEGEGRDRSTWLVDALLTNFNGVRHFLGYSRLCLHLVISMVISVVGFMCYYGHVENTSNLGGDGFTKYVYGAVVEIPAFSVPFLANKFGRKLVIMGLFSFSGLASALYEVFHQDQPETALALALCGRMCSCGAYYIALQYVSELMPTIVRGTCVASCEIAGGIGLFISPQIVYLGRNMRSLPLLIFAGLSFLGSGAAMFLPETAGHLLPQTLEDGNDFGRDQSFCSFLKPRRSGSKGDAQAHDGPLDQQEEISL